MRDGQPDAPARDLQVASLGINDTPAPGRASFHFLAEHYLKADFGADSMRPNSANTISHVEHIVRAYLVPRFGNEIAEDIKPLDIQRWFKSLRETDSLAWTTIAKMRGVMGREEVRGGRSQSQAFARA
jgi:hypothetical protein